MLDTLLTSRTFTREQYHELLATGELREDDRVELIEGEILEMSPIGPQHAAVIKRLIRLFQQVTNKDRSVLSVQDPIVLGAHTELQPDLCVLEFQADLYQHQHPTANDILLLIEVMVTSHEYDWHTKLPLYARHGIQEVWLVDVPGRVLNVCRKPQSNGQYAELNRIVTNDAVSPLFADSLALSLTDLLGNDHA